MNCKEIENDRRSGYRDAVHPNGCLIGSASGNCSLQREFNEKRFR